MNGLIPFQEKIYRHMKTKASSFEGRFSKQHIEYIRYQYKESKRKFKLSNEEKLFISIAKSQVVYLGDFHTFDQSTKNLERILRVLTEGKAQITLGMEMVHARYQIEIDRYMNHLISEQEFLSGIDYHESWRFPWGHYKTIFDFARKSKIRVVGLNSDGELTKRDEFAAKRIVEILSQNPNSTVIALFGELHITQKKLPAQVTQNSPFPINQTIIHQNLDEVYWRLLKQNKLKEQGSTLIEFGGHEFCLISSPPWIKYESMVYWFDNLSDDPDFDLRDSQNQSGLKTFTSNIHDNFLFLCQNLAKVILPDTKFDQSLDDFNLYDYTNLDYVLDLTKSIQSSSERNFVKWKISTGAVLKIPQMNSYYLSHYSINRLAMAAGMHLFHHQIQQMDNSKGKAKGNKINQLKNVLVVEAFSHLCSKIVNPNRKTDLYLDVLDKYKNSKGKNKKEQNKNEEDKRNYSNVIKLSKNATLLKKNTGLQKFLRDKNPKQIFNIGKLLGRMMGEFLFEYQIKKHNVPANDLGNILIRSMFIEKEWAKLVAHSIGHTKFIKLRKHTF